MFNKKQMNTIEYWKRQWNSVTENNVGKERQNEGQIRLQFTAVYCKTIFWNSKGNKKDKDEK